MIRLNNRGYEACSLRFDNCRTFATKNTYYIDEHGMMWLMEACGACLDVVYADIYAEMEV